MAFRDKGKADELRIDVLEDEVEERDDEIAELKAQLEEARNPKPQPEPDPAKPDNPKPLLLLLGLTALASGVWFVSFRQPAQEREDAAVAQETVKRQVVSQATFQSFSFKMTPDEAASHLGQAPAKTLKFEVENFGEATINFRPRHDQVKFLIKGRRQGELAKVRLQELAPYRFRRNQVARSGAFVRVRDFSYILNVRSTWSGDNSAALADAFWAAGRYATFGGDKPSAAELRILNGPSLKEASAMRIDVPVEEAGKGVAAVIPYAKCSTTAFPGRSAQQLVCQTELNHPLFTEAFFIWPNVARGAAYGVRLMFANTGGLDTEGSHAQNVRQCLEATPTDLPQKGKSQVVDHASGESSFVWPLEGAAHMVLRNESLYFGSEMKAGSEQSKAWVPLFGTLMETLDACGR